MQIPSLLQMEAECHHGALAKRIGPLSDDTIGYSLERQSPEAVFALSCEIARRLKRNGVLRSDWSRGLVVGAIDGIEICSSFARCCDACMEREVQHKVNGEMRTGFSGCWMLQIRVRANAAMPAQTDHVPGAAPPQCTISLPHSRQHLTNRLDHELRFIELDVMATVRGDNHLPVARHRGECRMI